MIPIPAKLAAAGVRDMVRVTDARMSGTSFGTCVLHVAPEAAVGGPLALVRTATRSRSTPPPGGWSWRSTPQELSRRAAEYAPPVSEHLRGWPALYQQHVTQADLGCDFDFLRADTAGQAPVRATGGGPVVMSTQLLPIDNTTEEESMRKVRVTATTLIASAAVIVAALWARVSRRRLRTPRTPARHRCH